MSFEDEVMAAKIVMTHHVSGDMTVFKIEGGAVDFLTVTAEDEMRHDLPGYDIAQHYVSMLNDGCPVETAEAWIKGEEPEMGSRFPDCPEGRSDCRLVEGPGTSTCMAWCPEYDRAGRLLNEDPNTFTAELSCGVCGRRWTRITQGSKVSFEDSSEVCISPGAIRFPNDEAVSRAFEVLRARRHEPLSEDLVREVLEAAFKQDG